MAPRIVTLTLNPAVDHACIAAAVRPTHKTRTTDERFDPGGGGINVARVLAGLGFDALALIMTGGATGRLVEEMLDREGVRWRRLPIAGMTRITLNVHDRQSGEEYRFVPEGPQVSEAEWHQALDSLETVEAEFVVASGSLPRGVPADFYARAAAIAARRGQGFVLDSSGAALAASVGQGIALLKLSLRELETLVGRDLADPVAQIAETAALMRSGAARRIAVSLGADGALLAGQPDGGAIIRLPALPVVARSAVGAGDCFLAGLLAGLLRGLTDREALALAIAAGAASVGTYGTAKLDPAVVEPLQRQALEALPIS